MKAKYILPVALLVAGAATYGQTLLEETLQVRFSKTKEAPTAEMKQRGELKHARNEGKAEFMTAQRVDGPKRVDARGNIANNLVLYGLKSMDQGSDRSGGPYNVIRVHAVNGTPKYDVSPEIQTPGKAAFYDKGNFYVINDESFQVYLYTYDAKTWELKSTDKLMKAQDDYLRQVGTVDPTTGKAYFMFWGQIDWTTFETMRPLYELDLETKECVQVGTVQNLFIQTLFFDMEGQMYGIPYNEAKLYKIDKASGAHELVGDINVDFSRYPNSQSACVDPATGIVYWAVPDFAGESWIYALDTQTAQAELVTDMPNDEHLLGLYIPYVDPAAPDACQDINYADGQLTFTVPNHAYITDTACETVIAQVSVDGELMTKEAKGGETVTFDIDLAEGVHTLVINAKSEYGEGAERIYDLYAGEDTPVAVSNLAASRDINGKVTVTWSAPDASVNGGAFDDAKLRYDVVRLPDNVTIATGIAETTVNDQLPEKHDHYNYVVTAKIDEKVSEAAISDDVIFGNIWIPNYTEQFRAPEDWALFTVVDNNQDGCTFTYIESQQYGYLQGNGSLTDANPNGGKGMDDYLITPAIRLEKNTEYRFRFDITELMVNEHINILLGTSNKIEDLKVLKGMNIYWANDNTGITVYFNVPEDGLYYLALQNDSPEYSYSYRFDNFSIDLYSRFDGPAAVTNLTAKAGAKGAIANTISFNAPTKTFKGAELTEAMTVLIENDGKLLATINNVEPGQAVSWEDDNVTAGSQTYRVYTINAAGQGQEALVTNWVGYDYPARPEITEYHQNSKYQPVISWNAVSEAGVNGGYVDPSTVTYLICKYNAYDYSNPWVVVATTTGLTAHDNTYTSYYGQENVNYAVFPQNEMGVGEGSAFGITLGQPWDTPYSESFSYGFAWNSPWTLYSDTYYYAWSIETGSGLAVKPYDETGDDGGMLYYTYVDSDSNGQFMAGPRVSLSSLTKGELSFYMYHGFEADPEDVVLEVYANYNDRGWQRIGTVDYNNGTTGWARSSFKLDTPEVPEGYGPMNVQIGFAGITTVPSASIFIDLIKIEDGVDTDLALASISGNKRIEVGQKEKLSFAVANYGMESIKSYGINYKVVSVADESVVYQNSLEGSKTITSGQVVTHSDTFELNRAYAGQQFVVKAEVITDGDELADNNAKEFRFTIHGSSLPAASELSAEETAEGVNLNWTAPAKSEITDPVSDDFEQYESFIIDNIGDWQVYDGDGGIPVYFGGPSIPHDFDAKAWQIWAPVEAGFSLEKFPVLTPHSGDKVLTSWTASDGETTTLPTDDWLISSEIEGGSDVSFWAKIPNAGADPENVEVLYSTTDQLPESFIAVDGDQVPSTTEWIKYEYTLPADARYFAVRNWNNGGNVAVLFLDDIEYTPLYGATTQLTFKGYRIYRNGEMIADEVQETTYFDAVEKGDYAYFVTAVWAEGESNGTNQAIIGNPMEIGHIMINAAQGELFRIDGVRVAQPTEAGVYLQRNGNKINKVIIR